ncbi:MAG: 7-carboxy-7-deazaguanine synthase QueE [Bacteroidaceae bacterium]|nr:7-carboxy-7-deazaguanine synthase QueE [Bacteroidaceae bacterium]
MRINEIFYSLQGEGCHTGVPAVFVRFAGCNLKCSFCDTDFQSYTEMSEDEIVDAVLQYPSSVVILTGGEPTLQLTSSLLHRLSAAHRQVHIETNGTHPLPEGPIHWVVCSPKYAKVNIQRIDELKVVYEAQDMSVYDQYQATAYSLQPCDTGDPIRNQELIQQTINYILQHPKWKLSLQTHKILNVR